MNIVLGLTKDFLYQEYIGKRKSTYQIAKEVNCSGKTVQNRLKENGIPRRSAVDSHRGQHSSIKTEFKAGVKPWNFKGEIKRNGYTLVHIPDHPYCTSKGYVRKHRLVIEREIGRYLKPNERVHHINEIRSDNERRNLIAFTSESAHQRFHKDVSRVRLDEIIFDGSKQCSI